MARPGSDSGTLAKARDLQIHVSLTIVSRARNRHRLGFVFLGNDH
jgi:hypothetical protein